MRQTQIIMDKLLGCNPYEGWSLTSQVADIRRYESILFETFIKVVQPKIIIEVGSWKGSSAICMAKIIQKYNLDTTIICVDTWLGSPEHWLDKENKLLEWGFHNLNLKYGYPSLYYTFLNNVVLEKCEDVIVPFPGTSENAYQVFRNLNIIADLIYVDAAHEYEPALRDIRSYWQLLSDQGILCGDDYITFPGVTQAVNEFAAHIGYRILAQGSTFVCPKGDYNFSILPLS